VEGNFLHNIDYGYCYRAGIRVLNISPVFAEPVAEAALGMAIDLAAASRDPIAISVKAPSNTAWRRTAKHSLSSART